MNGLTVSSPAAPLAYGNTGGDNTHLVYWATPDHEATGMAKAIQANIANYGGDKHLVMTTRRKFGYMLRDELLALDPNLRVKMVFSESPLDTWPVREAFIAFCLLADPDGPTWRAWLGYRTRTDTASNLAPERNSSAYLNLLASVNDTVTMPVMADIVAGVTPVSGTGQLAVRGRALRAIEVRDRYEGLKDDPAELIAQMFDPDSWTPWLPDDVEQVKNDFAVMNQLTAELLDEESTGQAANKLQAVARKLRAHIAARDTDCMEGEEPQVTIATLWSAKGVTADHVYVTGLCREAIPGSRREEYPGTDVEYYEEQQRLFYVTVTRSKGTLVLSRPQRVKRGDAPRLGLVVNGNGYYPDLHISPFLQAILSKLPAAVSGEVWGGCT